MPDNNNIYKKNTAVVSRRIKPEMLLVPIKAGSANLNEVYLLSEVAGRIWELLDGQRNKTEIVQTLTQEYEVSGEEAGADYEELINNLAKLAVIVLVQQ